MRKDIAVAFEAGILTPAENLRMNDIEEEDYKKGLVFEKSHEILTRGHVVMLSTRIEKVKERAEISDYPLSPTKYKFEKVVRCYAVVYRFLRGFRCIKGKLSKQGMKFRMLQVSMEQAISRDMEQANNWSLVVQRVGLSFGAEKPGMNFKGEHHVNLSSEDISYALEFLFKKGTSEVKHFHKNDFIKKISVEKSDILMSRSRILMAKGSNCWRFRKY